MPQESLSMATPADTKSRAPPPDSLFRIAADQAPQVMWIVNPKGAVTYLNQAWYELVGGQPPKWYGHEWGEVVHPEDLAQMQGRWKAVSVTGTIFEGTRRVLAQDRTWHTLAYKATPVFDASGLVCWVGMDSDITTTINAQAALRDANEDLDAFTYTASHDLRAPLVTLQGLGALLSRQLEAVAAPKANDYLGHIQNGLKQMEQLLDGLLTLARLRRDALHLQDVDLSQIAQSILETTAIREPERTVATSVEPGLIVWADRRLITSLLENLLGNAWKFTRGVPRAEISVGRVQLSSKDTVFFVRDNGKGFDMGRSGSLFKPFQRLHPESEVEGPGIGLASVQRIVKRHGGKVWADSFLGQGACFYVSLPRHELLPMSG